MVISKKAFYLTVFSIRTYVIVNTCKLIWTITLPLEREGLGGGCLDSKYFRSGSVTSVVLQYLLPTGGFCERQEICKWI